MNRDQALELVRSHVTQEHLLKHMIATEAVMSALAERSTFNRTGHGDSEPPCS